MGVALPLFKFRCNPSLCAPCARGSSQISLPPCSPAARASWRPAVTGCPGGLGRFRRYPGVAITRASREQVCPASSWPNA
eukprot:3755861-Alexandrium_andersonii.AAC.1